ncbi:MAG: ParB/RepB/Spo0J family partition protein [Oscillospiraceae bacterium]|nr:ParB/RepB/Spo0J family partition protein [Oscillospiraceae bacterium]
MLGQGKRGQRGAVVLSIKPEEIFPNPNQPRRRFDEKELAGLAESIRQNGILQPLTVRPLSGGGYELIAGERRLRAARLAGLPYVPCISSTADDARSAVLALVENLQREDLGFFEEAQAMQHLMDCYGFPQEQLAHSLGKASSTLSNKLRLLRLPQELRGQILAAGLTERHARALLRLENEAQQRSALQTIIARELNVAATDRLIETLLAAKPGRRAVTVRLVRDVRIFLNTINHAVETMRSSGIPAESSKLETEDYMEFTVRIPKTPAAAACGGAGASRS